MGYPGPVLWCSATDLHLIVLNLLFLCFPHNLLECFLVILDWNNSVLYVKDFMDIFILNNMKRHNHIDLSTRWILYSPSGFRHKMVPRKLFFQHILQFLGWLCHMELYFGGPQVSSTWKESLQKRPRVVWGNRMMVV